MKRGSRNLVSLVLLPALLSGCVVTPWWDDGYRGGRHHGRGGGSHHDRR